MKIFKSTDRVAIKFEGVTVLVAPLSYAKKIEIGSKSKRVDGELLPNVAEQTLLLLKYSIKKVDGLEGFDGQPYLLTFEQDSLTDDCAADLANFFLATKFNTAIGQVNSGSLDPIEGVEITVNPNL